MAKIWILAANGGNATLFSADSPVAPLAEVFSLDNPDARAKQMTLTSDRPGRSADSHGQGGHVMETEIGPKEQGQIRFAKQVADRLEQGRLENDFERLVVVATPSFLGHLRASFAAPLRSRVSLEIDKDYTGLNAQALRARLPDRL